MSPAKRIALNVIATYGRSVYALLIGIFTSRWVLMALGSTDYGLIGLVGGLVFFVSFVNDLMSYAVARFYAVSIGASHRTGNEEAGIEECRRCFNSALVIHLVVPFFLLAVGYPIGEWAVRHFLTIPQDRILPCVWVWRFTCCSCFFGMVSVPFCAFFTAKQDIAELTLYDLGATTGRALFIYYMATHPGFWLTRYSLAMCVVSIMPTLLKVVRAHFKYNECRLVVSYLADWKRMKEIAFFGLARFWTMLSSMLSGQGNAILVNKFLGPIFNASISLGNTVVAQTNTLSNSLLGAFWPAIATAAGEGDVERVHRLSFGVCRLGTLLVLVFAIPLSIEIDTILGIWLKTPPPCLAELCIVMLFSTSMAHTTEGIHMPIMAFGRGVARYSWVVGWSGFLNFGLAFLFFLLDFGFHSICLSIVLGAVILCVLRLYLGETLADLRICTWFRLVFFPVGIVAACTITVGCVVRFLPATFGRMLLTGCVCEAILLTLSWKFILRSSDRAVVLNKISDKISFFRRSTSRK